MKGISVILYERTLAGYDDLNNPVYEETPVVVNDVLVAQPTTDDITSTINLYGKHLDYILGLPKGDSHDWVNARVEIFGKSFRSFGDVIEGIEANVPTRWHKQVRVQRYG